MVHNSMLFSMIIVILCGFLSTPLSKAEPFGFTNITMTPATCVFSNGILTIEVTNSTDDQIEYRVVSPPDVDRTQMNNGVFTDLQADRNYTITASNQTIGQSIQAEFTVTKSFPIHISNVVISPVTTKGGSDGIIGLAVENGVPPYEFFLSNQQVPVSLFMDLQAGIYKVTVASAGTSCLGFDTDTVTVEVKEPIA